MIPLSSPDITEAEVQAAVEVLRSDRLSLGPKVQEFEESVCRLTGSRFAVAVNSGTSGLHLCVKASGIGPGDEVITTPFSFVASANAILFEGGVPVFVDIDPASYNIDVSRIEAAITPRTRAILPVHVFGHPCPMQEIRDIADRHGLAVIEDACEAIGARVNGRAAGTFGETGVFAFYPNKQMTTGEGGVIVTGDDEVARLCRSWRNQGRGEGGSWLQHERLGYNYRLSDINCAIGSAQLGRLPEMLRRRAQVADWYTERLKLVPEIVPPALPAPGADMSWFVYVVRLRDEFSRQHRDRVLEELRGLGIGCSDYFTPIHLQLFYRERFGFQEGDFPLTERISERTIALPFFNHLPQGDIDYICESLRRVVRTLVPQPELDRRVEAAAVDRRAIVMPRAL